MTKEVNSFGSKLVSRMQGFTEKLDKMQSPDELPKVLTVRKATLNLSPKKFSGEEVKDIRSYLKVSQAVFAQFLGVSIATVRDWEQSINLPSGPACRILEEIQKEPALWFNKFRSASSVSSDAK